MIGWVVYRDIAWMPVNWFTVEYMNQNGVATKEKELQAAFASLDEAISAAQQFGWRNAQFVQRRLA